MSHPFPGIDPYVEAQGRWSDFHPALIGYIRDALNDALPDSYLAQIGERLDVMGWDDEPPRSAYPDVVVSRRPTPREPESAVAVSTALAEWRPETARLTMTEVEQRYTWVEILHLPEQRLITSIEVLSPSNKSGLGRSEYLAKFRRLWASDVHLVEIDLLLGGYRLPLAPEYPKGDYSVVLARADRRPECEVSVWSIRQAPPTIPVPLLAPDPDVPLALATLVSTAYARGRYSRVLDYRQALPLPLAAEDLTWVYSRVQNPPPDA